MARGKKQQENREEIKVRERDQKTIAVKMRSGFKIPHPLWFILPLVAIAFFPILNNGFVNWDDNELITGNPLIRSLSLNGIHKIFTTFWVGNYQPLHILAYALQYHFWGLNPAGYHAVSLILFLGITSLVYFFIYRISHQNITVAVIATLLFSINAMRVESVAWASEHKDMLYALFYVAALITYVKYILSGKDQPRGWKLRYLIYTFAFFCFSVLSKVMAVSLVGALVMLDYYYERRLSISMLLEKVPFVIVSIIIGLVQVKATASTNSIDTSNQFTHVERLLIASRNLMFFFYKMLVPVNLSNYHPYPDRAAGLPWPVEFYIAPFFVLILLTLVIWSMRKTRIIAFSVGFFIISLLLVLQYIAIGPTLFNERYSLLPAIPLSFLLASGIYLLTTRFPAMKMLSLGLTGVYIAIMFYLTFFRCSVWQNPAKLWTNVISQYPHEAYPYYVRSEYYGRTLGDVRQEMEDLNTSIRLSPTINMAFINRGIVYYQNNMYDSAISDFTTAIRLNAGSCEAFINRGVTWSMMGRYTEALNDYNRSIELDPSKVNNYLYRGYCYFRMGQPDLALQDYSTGIAMAPDNVSMFYFQRSQVLYAMKRFDEAYQNIQAARNGGVKVEDAWFDMLKHAAGQ
ncbi:MAG: tetratricopeptide repeat protein [Bacteroidota bacterium]|jgi:protein O-mannosyl-transferase